MNANNHLQAIGVVPTTAANTNANPDDSSSSDKEEDREGKQ